MTAITYTPAPPNITLTPTQYTGMYASTQQYELTIDGPYAYTSPLDMIRALFAHTNISLDEMLDTVLVCYRLERNAG